MGLYDDRMHELSESRPGRRLADRRGPFAPPNPQRRHVARPFAPIRTSPLGEASRRPPMDVQSLLFSRDEGWTASKAKQWAKSHGYKHGKVHVTDQYVRIRQFDPKGLKVKRTITLGKGIRAVVAREEDMAKRRKKSAAPKTTRRKPRRRVRETPVAEARRTRRRKARRAHETVAASRRPRRRSTRTSRRRRAPVGGHMMEASRRRRPRRRRVAREAWSGNRPGHSRAAKKGWARRKRAAAPARRRRRARETGYVMEARRQRRRPRRTSRRRTREFAYEEARRPRRRHRRAREEHVMEARRSRRRSYRRRGMHEARRGGGRGMYVAEMAVTILAAGVGFVLADGVDRFLATYDPSAATKPTDKFTSDGAGTLANTLNVAATPDWKRVGAAVGITALPAVASVYVDHPFVRSTLEGVAIGAGVSAFKMLWNNFLMPLLAPKDTSAAGLQKSYIARLYPAEIAAKINLDQKQQAVSAGGGSGALSGPPAAQTQAGVSAPAPDVGPFALSDYPTAADALRKAAGVSGDSPYPTAEAALRQQAGMGGDSPYPSAADALRKQAGVSQPPAYQPGPPSTPGPGPQAHRHDDSCGCGVGDNNPFLGFIGDAEEKDTLYTDGKAA